MGGHITRRGALIGSVLAIPALALRIKSIQAAPAGRVDLAAAFKTMEEKTGARLGVSAHDTGSDNRIEYRQNERFAMCSTFKFLASAAVLRAWIRGRNRLERMILIKKSDLVPYSPVTEKYVGKGMSIKAICEAAVTLSDNTAGNLMLDSLGGPKGLTKYARSLGDATFRLDRRETELNEAKPGDDRDTITPSAILKDMQKTVLSVTHYPNHHVINSWHGCLAARPAISVCAQGCQRIGASVTRQEPATAAWPTISP